MRIACALLIWTALSFALGGLYVLAMQKIKRRKMFLAERGEEFEVVGDFTLLKDHPRVPVTTIGESNV